MGRVQQTLSSAKPTFFLAFSTVSPPLFYTIRWGVGPGPHGDLSFPLIQHSEPNNPTNQCKYRRDIYSYTDQSIEYLPADYQSVHQPAVTLTDDLLSDFNL